MSGIYLIKNLINNKVYIGQSKRMIPRGGKHFQLLAKNKHDNIFLQRAYNKSGRENFRFSILEEASLESLTEREQYWMDFYDSENPEHGYNLQPAYNAYYGERIFTEEARARQLSGLRSNKGEKMSWKARQRCSESHLISHDKFRQNIKLINPKGEVIEHRGLKDFCRKYRFKRTETIRKLLQGKADQVLGGWRRFSEDQVGIKLEHFRGKTRNSCKHFYIQFNDIIYGCDKQSKFIKYMKEKNNILLCFTYLSRLILQKDLIYKNLKLISTNSYTLNLPRPIEIE